MNISTREDFPRLLNQLKLTTIGAEVGVFRARFSFKLMKGVKFKKFFGIDQWRHISGYDGPLYQKNQGNWESIYRDAKITMARYKNYKFIRQSSVQAAKMFEDEYFDFVYLDGDHRYEGIKEDIHAWLPKVRFGGMLAGDDYRDGQECQVKQVVDETFGEYVNTTVDQQSWFIIRQEEII